MKRCIIAIIRGYQAIQRSCTLYSLPLLVPAGCRSWPTCSEFTIQAVERDGVVHGLIQGCHRILHCNPLFHS